MIKTILCLGLALIAISARFRIDDPTGKTPPELNAKKWYNTAPISLDDLKGKAVLIQVFRTW